MDENTTFSVPGPSGLKSLPKKEKKKAVPSKQKTDKVSAPVGPPKEKKKTIMDLVCEAIEFTGEKKKGASAQAIKRYVKSEHGSEAASINSLINKALAKGVEKGILERPPHSKDATGAVGHFRLAKEEAPKRTSKVAKKQKIEQHVSDSEATEKPAKPRKRNLSDTYIEEMRKSFAPEPEPLVKQKTASEDVKKTKKVPLKRKANDKKYTSDTKIVVDKKSSKLMKSYSSDTEGEKKKRTKTTKEPIKKVKSDNSKTEKAEPSSKASSAKVKKLYNSAEGKENETSNKSGKTKSKK